MAKPKLSKAAISFIIEKRNDWNVNYTFADIAKLLKEDFGITITEQGVSKSYRKHKDDKEFQIVPIVATNKAADSKVYNSNMTSKEKHNERVKLVREGKSQANHHTNRKDKRDFDENAGKHFNADDYF